MGMTNSQFKGFIRFVLSDVKEIKCENEKQNEDGRNAKAIEKLEEVIQNLQASLED